MADNIHFFANAVVSASSIIDAIVSILAPEPSSCLVDELEE